MGISRSKSVNNRINWFNKPPGERVFYSIGSIIIGLAIENITKLSYEDFCKEYIFKPLEMWNTSFYFSDFEKDRIIHHYLWKGGRFFPYIPLLPVQVPPIEFPMGALKSTILDLSHYLIMHTSGGVYDGVRILNTSSVEEMHKQQYSNHPDGDVYHGLGWYGNETYGGHSGNAFGAYALMRIRYSDNAGIIYFTNQNSILRAHFHCNLPEEIKAKSKIERALFKKSDEL